MMTDKTDPKSEAILDVLFDERRAEDVAPPSDALMARMMADASAALADAAQEATPVGIPRRSPIAGLWAALGGWLGAGGLAAATLTGLWVGIAQPAALDSLNDALLGQSQTLTIFSTTDPFGSEG